MRELAAVRHRVARVHRQVHEDLLELRRVGLHAPERRTWTVKSTMSSPISRRSICSMLATTALRSSTSGWRICRRLKASSWRVRAPALGSGGVDHLDVRAGVAEGPERFRMS